MKKRRSTLWGAVSAIALVGWIAGGSYLFSQNCCEDVAATTAQEVLTANKLLIKDKGLFRAEAEHSIIYAINSSEPKILQDVSDQLFETIKYIKSNPLKKIIITGYYAEAETTNEELGRQRASAIQNIFLDAETPIYQVEVKAKSKKEIVRDQEFLLGMCDFKIESIAPTRIQDDLHEFDASFEGNLTFKQSSVSFLMQLSTGAKNNFAKVAEYLQNRRNRKLIVNGYFNSNEENTSGLPDLGIVRANKIKMLLTSLGAPENQIEIVGTEKSNLEMIRSSLYGAFMLNPIEFEITEMTVDYNEFLAKEKVRIEQFLKDKKVYRFKDFGLEDPNIVINDGLRTFMNELIHYISLNPRAAIYCVGHSNYTKDREFNYNQAYRRAEYVKNFLSKNGIHPDKIVVKSVGAKFPIGQENTVYGQHINRRVDLFVSLDGNTPDVQNYPDLDKKKRAKRKKNKKKKDKKNPDSKPEEEAEAPRMDIPNDSLGNKTEIDEKEVEETVDTAKEIDADNKVEKEEKTPEVENTDAAKKAEKDKKTSGVEKDAKAPNKVPKKETPKKGETSPITPKKDTL